MNAQHFNVALSLNGMVIRQSTNVTKIQINKDQVPPGTTKLYLILEDLDFLNFPHGADFIEYRGFDIVLENSFKIAPLSPMNGSHQYRLTVRALNEDNEELGSGQATQQFP